MKIPQKLLHFVPSHHNEYLKQYVNRGT